MDSSVPSSTPPPPNSMDLLHDTTNHSSSATAAATSTSVNPSLWDWSDLLDFTFDDQFPLSLDDPPPPLQAPTNDNNNSNTSNSALDRIRKRDPRLTCSNFLAGRVPCACPEIDEKLEAEEGLPGKKRVRVSRAGYGSARCQVPGCEVDISELKGYHKRHRVCLRCANATSVVIAGETKRYCQQCGKFHVLSDFDEGKRSCRRKLERHNNRRRRKPHDSKGVVDRELLPEDLPSQDAGSDGDDGKDVMCLGAAVKEILIESDDGHFSTHPSAPTSQNVNSDSGTSLAVSGETQTDNSKDDCKIVVSPSYYDNKSAYSSTCPTGRISFKLYDWNPAEFPRRLRHQIFQWLASMPVELEGYIRPGCTILTAFVAMPGFMWLKLCEDPISHLNDFLTVPRKLLYRKGPLFVYLDNMVFHITRDGDSVRKVNLKGKPPRLHQVHPIIFEAGKPMEFIACGSNLFQPNFRFLVSFDGEYLPHDYCTSLPRGHSEGGSNHDYQLCKIIIQHMEPNLFGPAFIEVENESGLSNFIPVLIGDKEVCSELKVIQQRFDASYVSNGSSCNSTSREMPFSEFLVDIAWLLKQPSDDALQTMTPSQIQRFNSVLNFLVFHESIVIMDKVLKNIKIRMDKMSAKGAASDAEWMELQRHADNITTTIIQERVKLSEASILSMDYTAHQRDFVDQKSSISNIPSVSPLTSDDLDGRIDGQLGVLTILPSMNGADKVPLLNKEVVMNVNMIKERPSKSCGFLFANRVLKPRLAVMIVATVALCIGVCAVLLHPEEASRFAISIRRCLTAR